MEIIRKPELLRPAGYAIDLEAMEGDGDRWHKRGWQGLTGFEFLFLYELIQFLRYKDITEKDIPSIIQKYEELWITYPEAKHRFSPAPELNNSLHDYIRDTLLVDQLAPYGYCSDMFCSIQTVNYYFFEKDVIAERVYIK